MGVLVIPLSIWCLIFMGFSILSGVLLVALARALLKPPDHSHLVKASRGGKTLHLTEIISKNCHGFRVGAGNGN